MKRIALVIAAVGIALLSWSFLTADKKAPDTSKFKEVVTKKTKGELQFGDLVFQSSMSGQSAAIQLATGSKYSHVGMIYEKKGEEWLVLEAVQPVKLTPLSQWVTHGDGNEYTVRRLKTANISITPEVITAMKAQAKSLLGKNYDIYFHWSDEEIYCSELVWKLYNTALKVELGELKPLSAFDLTHPIVKEIMKKRYGNDIPMESLMISPVDMFNSDLLETVAL